MPSCKFNGDREKLIGFLAFSLHFECSTGKLFVFAFRLADEDGLRNILRARDFKINTSILSVIQAEQEET